MKLIGDVYPRRAMSEPVVSIKKIPEIRHLGQ